jgi:hypothetical protein
MRTILALAFATLLVGSVPAQAKFLEDCASRQSVAYCAAAASTASIASSNNCADRNNNHICDNQESP